MEPRAGQARARGTVREANNVSEAKENGFPLKQLIGGEWRDAIGGGTWDLIDPGSEDLVTQVAYGDGADASAAIDATRARIDTTSSGLVASSWAGP